MRLEFTISKYRYFPCPACKYFFTLDPRTIVRARRFHSVLQTSGDWSRESWRGSAAGPRNSRQSARLRVRSRTISWWFVTMPIKVKPEGTSCWQGVHQKWLGNTLLATIYDIDFKNNRLCGIDAEENLLFKQHSCLIKALEISRD